MPFDGMKQGGIFLPCRHPPAHTGTALVAIPIESEEPSIWPNTHVTLGDALHSAGYRQSVGDSIYLCTGLFGLGMFVLFLRMGTSILAGA